MKTKILKVLEENSNLSNKEIGKIIGLSYICESMQYKIAI
jgi:DNA-binding Lrp family transcriptional regulator